MSGSTRPRTPGSTSAARHRAAPVVAYRRDKTVGTHPPNLSGLNTFKVGSTRYLCTSPAFVPTHRLACYQTRRKARYWARGARLPRRDSHPLEHAALPGRTVPYFLTISSGSVIRKQGVGVAGIYHSDGGGASRPAPGDAAMPDCGGSGTEDPVKGDGISLSSLVSTRPSNAKRCALA
jgi:hypothetical protein